jgi:hypothetical protein
MGKHKEAFLGSVYSPGCTSLTDCGLAGANRGKVNSIVSIMKSRTY